MKETPKGYRVVAHVRWLVWPYVGRACYLVERDGQVGFMAATEQEEVSGKVIIADNDPGALLKALDVVVESEDLGARKSPRKK